MGNKEDLTPLYVDGEQMPLLPEYEEPLQLGAPQRSFLLLLISLVGVSGVAFALMLFLRLSSPAIPDVPIPTLAFDPTGPRRTMFTASVLKTMQGESVVYIDPEKLAAEEKVARKVKKVTVEPRTHTLIRVPASFGDGRPVPSTRLRHPIDEKKRSFFVYHYQGEEPPFLQERFHYSRPLAQKLDLGRNPAIEISAGVLLYIYLYDGDEVLSLYF